MEVAGDDPPPDAHLRLSSGSCPGGTPGHSTKVIEGLHMAFEQRLLNLVGKRHERMDALTRRRVGSDAQTMSVHKLKDPRAGPGVAIGSKGPAASLPTRQVQLLSLQRLAGNRAVAGSISAAGRTLRVQAKAALRPDELSKKGTDRFAPQMFAFKGDPVTYLPGGKAPATTDDKDLAIFVPSAASPDKNMVQLFSRPTSPNIPPRPKFT